MKQNRLIIFTIAILIALTPLISTECSDSGDSTDTDHRSSDYSTASSEITDTETESSAPSSDTAISGTTFTFSNTGINVTNKLSSGYTIDGTALEITAPGTYIVTGICSDGSVKVKKDTVGVTLVLDNLNLSSTSTAPIVCAKSSETEIIVLGNNSLSDSAQNNIDSFPDNADAEGAVMKFKDGSNVTLSGSGVLNITANGKNGIKSGATTDAEGKASLTIRELTLSIDSPENDALNAESLLNIESGSLTISAGDDAIHSDYILNIGSETTSPLISIKNCCEGIEAAEIHIQSGNINIHATDDCINAANSDLGRYDFSLNIYGGDLMLASEDGDGIDSNGSITVTGGKIVVWTANMSDNQPLDADGLITITGGTVLAAGGSAGMGMNLNSSLPFVTFGSTGFSGRGFGQPSAATILKGTKLVISGDSEIYSCEALTDANYVFFSSDNLTEGGSYLLIANDTEIGTCTAQTGTTAESMVGGKPGGRLINGIEKGDRKIGQNGEMPDNFDPADRGRTVISGGKPAMSDDFDRERISAEPESEL